MGTPVTHGHVVELEGKYEEIREYERHELGEKKGGGSLSDRPHALLQFHFQERMNPLGPFLLGVADFCLCVYATTSLPALTPAPC